MAAEMIRAEEKEIRTLEFEIRLSELWRRDRGAYRFVRSRCAGETTRVATKPGGHFDQAKKFPAGRDGSQMDRTCSEQKGPTALPVLIRENTLPALSCRSPYSPEPQSWLLNPKSPRQ